MMMNVNAAFLKNNSLYVVILALGYLVELMSLFSDNLHTVMTMNTGVGTIFAAMAFALAFDERPLAKEWCQSTGRKYQSANGIFGDLKDKRDHIITS